MPAVMLTDDSPWSSFPTGVDRACLVTIVLSGLVCGFSTKLFSIYGGVEAASRVTSTVHALVSVTLCLYMLMQHDSSAGDGSGLMQLFFPTSTTAGRPNAWMHRDEPARNATAISLGYFLVDMLASPLLAVRLDYAIIFHHSVIATAFASCLVMDVGVTFCCLLLLNELSTPFVNYHHLLDPTFTVSRSVNGALMWFTFLLCRIVANAVVSVSIYFTVRDALVQVPMLVVPMLCIFASLQCINVWWFAKITVGLFRACGCMRPKGVDGIGRGGGGGVKSLKVKGT